VGDATYAYDATDFAKTVVTGSATLGGSTNQTVHYGPATLLACNRIFG
jgi:hypothetical protein